MDIVAATPDDLAKWHVVFLQSCQGYHESMQVIVGFGGDRLTAVQDGGGFFAKENEEVVGAVSYSPTAEYNKPSIVGLWVKNHNTDIAVELVKHAIDVLCIYVGEKILVDVTCEDEQNVYQEDKLGSDYYNKLNLRLVWTIV